MSLNTKFSSVQVYSVWVYNPVNTTTVALIGLSNIWRYFSSCKEGRVKKNENMKEMGNTVELEINSTNSIVDEI